MKKKDSEEEEDIESKFLMEGKIRRIPMGYECD